jgi:hypothetical protein
MNIIKLFIPLLLISTSAESLGHSILNISQNEMLTINFKDRGEYGETSESTLIIYGNKLDEIKIINNSKEYIINVNKSELSKLDNTINLYRLRTSKNNGGCTYMKSIDLIWHLNNIPISTEILWDNTCSFDDFKNKELVHIEELLKRESK